ncbi:MAG: leucine-rich repeat protein [Christensenellales bacterium]
MKSLRFAFYMLLVIGLLLTSMAAADKNEKMYQGLYYQVNNNQIFINGYDGRETVLRIPERIENLPVVAVIPSAFYRQNKLVSIHLPDSITKIGSYAFADCPALEEITLPKAWEEVSDGYGYLFKGCSLLKRITVPEGMVRLPDHAFRGCGDLEEVILPASLVEIGNSAFMDCTGLQSIKLPDKLSILGKSSFSGCTSLSSLDFPEGLTAIPESALYACSSIKNLRLPDGITEIGGYAFADCSALEEIALPRSWEKVVGGQSYSGYIFRGCSLLKRITVPEGMVRLPDYAFRGCGDLEEVILPASLVEIGNSAFMDCTGLQSIKLPDKLSILGKSSFSGCTSLSSLDFPEGLTAILESALYACSSIKNLKLPDGITEIGGYAFADCSALEEIALPRSWEKVVGGQSYSGYIFRGCSLLKRITVPEGMVRLPDYAFRGCGDLEEVILPASLVEIGNSAFMDCTGLQSIKLPDKLSILGKSSFNGCTSLSSLDFPEGLTAILESALYACSSIKNLRLPDGITEIGGYAFADCSALEEIALPRSWEKVVGGQSYSGYIFRGCSLLKRITVPEGMVRLPDYAFRGCGDLEEVILPASLVEIGNSAFMDCTALQSIKFPPNLESIGKTAFMNCNALSSLVLPESLLSLSLDAFEGCVALEEIVFQGQIPEDFHSDKARSDRGAQLAWTEPQKEQSGLEHEAGLENLKPGYGETLVQLQDAASGQALSGFRIRCQSASGEELVDALTDEKGQSLLVLPAGAHTLRVTGQNGYLDRNPVHQIQEGQRSSLTIELSKTSLLGGEITHHRMTAQEIEKAGIDVSALENQQVVEYQLALRFTAGLDYFELPVAVQKSDNRVLGIRLPEIKGYSSDNVVAKDGYYLINVKNNETPMRAAIYPIDEQFYLVIWGQVCWLKEMFHVQLYVYNQSSTETLEQVRGGLELPEGLSLAKMEGGRIQTARMMMNDLGPGESGSLDWYVRGDKKGDYHLRAVVSGLRMPQREEYDQAFVTKDPIRVLAGDALKMKIILEDAAFQGEDYKVVFEITNQSDVPVYHLSHSILAVGQYQATAGAVITEEKRNDFYKGELPNDWSVIRYEVYPVDDAASNLTLRIEKLEPGETACLELRTRIDFNSRLNDTLKRLKEANMLAGMIPQLAVPTKIAGMFLSAMDVRYYFQDMSYTELEGSTTSIPVSFEMKHVPGMRIIPLITDALVDSWFDLIIKDLDLKDLDSEFLESARKLFHANIKSGAKMIFHGAAAIDAGDPNQLKDLGEDFWVYTVETALEASYDLYIEELDIPEFYVKAQAEDVVEFMLNPQGEQTTIKTWVIRRPDLGKASFSMFPGVRAEDGDLPVRLKLSHGEQAARWEEAVQIIQAPSAKLEVTFDGQGDAAVVVAFEDQGQVHYYLKGFSVGESNALNNQKEPEPRLFNLLLTGVALVLTLLFIFLIYKKRCTARSDK